MGAPSKTGNAEVDAFNAKKAKQTEKDFLRVALGISTLGTSEIKTGGGEYGDETLADSLFPRGINDWASGRNESRKAIDAERAAMNAPARKGDLADELLAGAAGQQQLRAGARRGRRSTFISGAYGGGK